MESLKTDILLFRKGLEHYEAGHMDECRKLCEELLEKYPGHPGLMKLKCRLLMEKTGENLQEAEQFLEKALRFFPEDGYFMKYLADILWMKGNGQKALQLYARVKENTANGFVWLEMDKLFRPYKGQILRNCEEMIGSRQRTEALQTMEMWQKIMPEDEDIRAGWYLAKISCVRTQSQIEKLIREILEKQRCLWVPVIKKSRIQGTGKHWRKPGNVWGIQESLLHSGQIWHALARKVSWNGWLRRCGAARFIRRKSLMCISWWEISVANRDRPEKLLKIIGKHWNIQFRLI